MTIKSTVYFNWYKKKISVLEDRSIKIILTSRKEGNIEENEKNLWQYQVKWAEKNI